MHISISSSYFVDSLTSSVNQDESKDCKRTDLELSATANMSAANS